MYLDSEEKKVFKENFGGYGAAEQEMRQKKKKKKKVADFKRNIGTSLVVHWLGIHLPM